MAEMMTDKGLVVGLIPEKEQPTPTPVEQKVEEKPVEKPVAKRTYNKKK